MTRTLSICIPTLNRCDLLCQALQSIFGATIDPREVEICISNNCSEHDYAALEHLLAEAPDGLEIRYVVQPQRLPLDEHMLAVRQMATSPYLYFLGDDDFFLEDELPRLMALIAQEAPDLAIFNGRLVDATNAVIGQHFALPPRHYDDIAAAFDDLRDKGMFGAVLVQARHIDDTHFKALFGTAHGYGCYWFSLLSEQPGRARIHIVVPDFPLVALRMGAKNYSHLEVYFRDIPYEIAVYQRHLPAGRPQWLNHRFASRYLTKISSFTFLAQMRLSGVEILSIRDINPAFFERHGLKIRAIDALVRSGGYEVLKRVYQQTIKRWRVRT